MGLFDRWVIGIDLDAEQARSDALDKALREENQRDLASGAIDQAAFDLSNAQIAGGYIDVRGEVGAAFQEGFNDGVNNISGAAGSLLNLPFRLIPWQGYVIAAVVLFIYMGGASTLKGRLAK